MNIRSWDELLDVDLPRIGPVTENTIEHTLNEASRFRGSMRIATGRVWIDSEFEEYRFLVLNKPLP